MKRDRLLLLASVFVIAVCSLVYELLAGALSSYLLGDSITHFSLVIGVFLSAMGLGAYLSKFIERGLLRTFIILELWVGLTGGFSALILFGAFTYTDAYPLFLFGLGGLIGTLIGFEIPLLIRILKDGAALRVTLADVLTVDYVGALAASILFPTLLVPYLGMMRTSFLFGLMNVGVAAAAVWFFRRRLGRVRSLALACGAAVFLLGAGLLGSNGIVRFLDAERYEDEIIFSKTTRYQKIVLTRWRRDVRLFLDGNLQFSTVDEHRYHEALIHPALSLRGRPERALILGGGDGMAVREALKHPSLREVVLVDLDPEMTHLFSANPLLRRLNGDSLRDPRVRVVNGDAMAFLSDDKTSYDAIFMDLPDPNNLSLGKLYTKTFFRLALKRLRPGGLLATQATSPFYSREAFWCIVKTVRESFPGGTVAPYHAYIPSFGEWGFVLASNAPFDRSTLEVPVETRFLDRETARGMFSFPKDLLLPDSPANRLDNQILVRLYEKGYKRFNF